MAVMYEVNLDVDERIAGDFIVWLHDHMRKIRALPGFTQAQLFDVTEPAAPAGRMHVCVQYRLVDGEALAVYLRDYAQSMRVEGVERFGDRFIVHRRVMHAVADY